MYLQERSRVLHNILGTRQIEAQWVNCYNDMQYVAPVFPRWIRRSMHCLFQAEQAVTMVMRLFSRLCSSK